MDSWRIFKAFIYYKNSQLKIHKNVLKIADEKMFKIITSI